MVELSRNDVWVLHAVLLCAKDGVADLSDVIGTADMSNHEIVSWDEVNGAVLQLRACGLFAESGLFVLTEAALELPMEGNVFETLLYLRRHFRCPEWRPGPVYQFPSNQTPLVTEDEYHQALAKYQQQMDGLMKSR